MEKMETWKNLINKKAKVIFEDGEKHYSKKEGLISEITETHIILLINSHSEALNLNRILRVEEIL